MICRVQAEINAHARSGPMIVGRGGREDIFGVFPAAVRRFQIDPRVIVHVGAHLGEEVPYYRGALFDRIILVEPNPALADKLREIPGNDVEVIEAACDRTMGRAVLHISSRSMMSTLDKPHKPVGAVEVNVITLQEIQDADPHINVAVVDAQGLEKRVLEGGDLKSLDMVIVECHRENKRYSRYAATFYPWMARRGFVAVEEWEHTMINLTDTVFVKKRHRMCVECAPALSEVYPWGGEPGEGADSLRG